MGVTVEEGNAAEEPPMARVGAGEPREETTRAGAIVETREEGHGMLACGKNGNSKNAKEDAREQRVGAGSFDVTSGSKTFTADIKTSVLLISLESRSVSPM